MPQLARTIGIRLGPSNVEDIIIFYVSNSYKHFHELLSNQLMAIDKVMDTFKGAAIQFRAKYGYMPTVFIDGADLLTEHNAESFLTLLSHAKVFANLLITLFIFVSSEGSIMPILKSSSAMS